MSIADLINQLEADELPSDRQADREARILLRPLLDEAARQLRGLTEIDPADGTGRPRKTIARLKLDLKEERAAGKTWRDLALQFDMHRIAALSVIRAVAMGRVTPEGCAEFLKARPPSPTDCREKELETPKMLVLSTAHITAETASNFELMTDNVPSIFYAKEEYGWFIPIIAGFPWSHTVSEDLVAIRKLAELTGCSWIMLDRDGDTVDELPTYDW